MQKQIMLLATLSLFFTACSDETIIDDVLVKVILPDGSGSCDTTGVTPYEAAYDRNDFTRLIQQEDFPANLVLQVDKNQIQFFDTQNEIWSGSIASAPTAEVFNRAAAFYAHDGLICARSDKDIAVIDPVGRQVRWSSPLPTNTYPKGSLSGIDGRVFTVGYNDAERCGVVYAADLNSGAGLSQILVPAYSKTFEDDWNGFGNINSLNAFLGADGNQYLLIGYREYVSSNKILNYNGLYNLSQQQWVFEHQLLHAKAQGLKAGVTLVVDNKAYMSYDDSLYVMQLPQGNMIKQVAMPAPAAPANGKARIDRMWANEQYLLVATTSGVRVYHRPTFTFYRQINDYCNQPIVNFAAGVLAMPGSSDGTVWNFTDGRILANIKPACEGESYAVLADGGLCWKNQQGAVKLWAPSYKKVYQYAIRQ